jgi:hypothetical protein
MSFSRKQLGLLVLLTLVWGLNWPIMKVGISGWPGAPQPFPPLTFRALSIALGLPLLWLALRVLRVPLAVPRVHWGELLRLTTSNMLVWHLVMIVALQALSSGRAAILGYTMPVFSALWGAVGVRRPAHGAAGGGRGRRGAGRGAAAGARVHPPGRRASGRAGGAGGGLRLGLRHAPPAPQCRCRCPRWPSRSG